MNRAIESSPQRLYRRRSTPLLLAAVCFHQQQLLETLGVFMEQAEPKLLDDLTPAQLFNSN